MNYEYKITQLWHKRRCLNYGNNIISSNKIGEFLFRVFFWIFVVFFYSCPKKTREKEMRRHQKREREVKNVICMARKWSLTMTPSQNIMCIVLLLFFFIWLCQNTRLFNFLSIVLDGAFFFVRKSKQVLMLKAKWNAEKKWIEIFKREYAETEWVFFCAISLSSSRMAEEEEVEVEDEEVIVIYHKSAAIKCR